jgi:hypothetical protein
MGCRFGSSGGASYWQRALICTFTHLTQEKSSSSRTFLHRTDHLAVWLGLSVQDLPPIIGISRRLLFQCRSADSSVTGKTWCKLEAAERMVGITAFWEVPDKIPLEDRVAYIGSRLGPHPNTKRNIQKWHLESVERRTTAFFAGVRVLAAWAAKAADQIPDKTAALDLKSTSAEVAGLEPEFRAFIESLNVQAREMLGDDDSPQGE